MSSPTSPVNLMQSLILVVDDNPGNIQVLIDMFRQTTFRLSIAKSGEAALSRAQKILPDLILLDVQMEGIDGFETCRQLKANADTCHIPVIFLSALSDIKQRLSGFSVGGVDYITKPFQVEEVMARVKTHLDLKETKAELQHLNTTLEGRVHQRTAELEEANQKLLASEEEFRLAFELAPIGMALLALDGRLIRTNQAFQQLLSYSEHDLVNRAWTDLMHPDEIPEQMAALQTLRDSNTRSIRMECRYLTHRKKVVYTILQIVLVQDSLAKPLHFLLQCLDITVRREMEIELRRRASYDSLTQLPNRALLMEHLDLALQKFRRYQDQPFAALFIDLDRFKMINDSLGHQVGDQLLISVANILRQEIRSSDTVSRLGGDEFVILLDPIKHVADAIRVAERIFQRLKFPIRLNGRDVYTAASIGIALSSPDYAQGTDLLRDADIAMYRAKKQGTSRCAIFNQTMHNQAIAQLQLESDLHQALERDEFRVHYQPIISINTGKIIGFEALVRWQHPQKGLVSPAGFIEVAEYTDLIVPIGNWVLQTACQQMARWQASYPTAKNLSISVNLASKQLQSLDFVDTVEHILTIAGLSSQCLKLELTERMLIDNSDEFITLLSALKRKGIELSIDDFGIDYSSLSTLHRFPISCLKVDRSFVNQIGREGYKHGFVETIVSLAQQLSLTVIAEGVETVEQLNHLKTLHCEAAQGFLFSRPVDATTAEALIESDSCWQPHAGSLKAMHNI
ncbi:MAG: EAL domain-containing protein [Cyanobacteria bacterium P01_A01_bin.37]